MFCHTLSFYFDVERDDKSTCDIIIINEKEKTGTCYIYNMHIRASFAFFEEAIHEPVSCVNTDTHSASVPWRCSRTR